MLSYSLEAGEASSEGALSSGSFSGSGLLLQERTSLSLYFRA